MNILIGGDLVPTDSNKELFSKGDISTLLGDELLNIWKESDIRILNLETPLTNKKNPILKCGPNLMAPTNTIEGIKKLNPSLITLANNHILDQGKEGLDDTINLLKDSNIPFVGIGDNIKEARKGYIIEKNDINIGVYACAEYEFTIATEHLPGANLFDPFESLEDIQSLKKQSDYVIVLYHGGKEHYRYPSPYLQKVCRKIVEKGADLVVCQHSHCIGALEEYRGSTIVYGQGNFIFDDSESEFERTSLIVKVNIDNKTVDYIPICKDGRVIRLANIEEGEKILNEFYERSEQIKEQSFIKDQYEKLALQNKSAYLGVLAGNNKVFNKINSILKGILINRKYHGIRGRRLLNRIECEAHRELVLTILKQQNK